MLQLLSLIVRIRPRIRKTYAKYVHFVCIYIAQNAYTLLIYADLRQAQALRMHRVFNRYHGACKGGPT